MKGMKRFAPALLLLSACAHEPYVPFVELIMQRPKAPKSGVVEASNSSAVARMRATELMDRFCAPGHSEVTQFDIKYKNEGSEATVYHNRYFDSVDISNLKSRHLLIQFECKEGAPEIPEMEPEEKAASPPKTPKRWAP